MTYGTYETMTISALVPFQMMEETYIEKFRLRGVDDINPALQDYLFEDDTPEVAVVADGNFIWVVSSSYLYELKARVIGAALHRKLMKTNIDFDHWRP